MPKFPHTSVGSVEGSSHASNQLDSFRRFDTTLDLSQTDTAMANTALAQRRAVKSYPRRTDVRATALTLPPLSSAAPRHTPRQVAADSVTVEAYYYGHQTILVGCRRRQHTVSTDRQWSAGCGHDSMQTCKASVERGAVQMTLDAPPTGRLCPRPHSGSLRVLCLVGCV